MYVGMCENGSIGYITNICEFSEDISDEIDSVEKFHSAAMRILYFLLNIYCQLKFSIPKLTIGILDEFRHTVYLLCIQKPSAIHLNKSPHTKQQQNIQALSLKRICIYFV